LADFNKFWQAILKRNLMHVSLVLATSLFDFDPLWEHSARQEHSILELVVRLRYSSITNYRWIVLLFLTVWESRVQ